MPSRMSRCKIPCLWHRHLRFFFQCVQCCNTQVSGLNWARHPKRIITHGFWGPSKFPVPCRSVCRLLFLFEKQFPLILCKGTVAALRKWKCSWIFGDISCSTGGNSLPSFLSQSLPVNCCGPETPYFNMTWRTSTASNNVLLSLLWAEVKTRLSFLWITHIFQVFLHCSVVLFLHNFLYCSSRHKLTPDFWDYSVSILMNFPDLFLILKEICIIQAGVSNDLTRQKQTFSCLSWLSGHANLPFTGHHSLPAKDFSEVNNVEIEHSREHGCGCC